jgi:hypothetical protein
LIKAKDKEEHCYLSKTYPGWIFIPFLVAQYFKRKVRQESQRFRKGLSVLPLRLLGGSSATFAVKY